MSRPRVPILDHDSALLGGEGRRQDDPQQGDLGLVNKDFPSETPNPPSFDPSLSREEVENYQALRSLRLQEMQSEGRSKARSSYQSSPHPSSLERKGRERPEMRDVALGVIEPRPLNTPVTY